MRVVVDPPFDQWRLAARRGDRPVIATGHQAWLWHPGILAKDIAMAVAAERLAEGAARRVHLVVDHDVHETMPLTVPVTRGDRLETATMRLGDSWAMVPTGCQPPVKVKETLESLHAARKRLGAALSVDLQPLISTFEAVGDGHGSLAEQITAVTVELMRTYVGDVEVAYSSRLLAQLDAAPLVDRMLREAARCVRAYNAAVSATPEAGVARLSVEPDRVELPLWQLDWGRPRRRVYADLAVPEDPVLVDEAGNELGRDDCQLAPKALFLTAVMRSRFCDLFIHGLGGGVYDRVMEAWWTGWTGESAESLAPMAVVTADLRMEFAAPVADRAELTRAQWYRHHLPHNVDRVLAPGSVDGPLVAEKRRLLAHMDDDRDAGRRWGAFRRVHAINAELVAEHRQAVDEAEARLRRAQVGLHNAVIARRRDWFFGLYPSSALAELRRAVENEAGAAAPLR